MAEILLRGKRLSELKVTVLKEELDKRGLPKKGVKTLLISRLKNAILREELEMAQSQREDASSEELLDTDSDSVKDADSCAMSEAFPSKMENLNVTPSVVTNLTGDVALEETNGNKEPEPLVSPAMVTACSSTELALPQIDNTVAATLPSDETQGNSSSAPPHANSSFENNETPVVDPSCENVAPNTQDAVDLGDKNPGTLEFIPLGSSEDSEGSVGPEDNISVQSEPSLDIDTSQSGEEAPVIVKSGEDEHVEAMEVSCGEVEASAQVNGGESMLAEGVGNDEQTRVVSAHVDQSSSNEHHESIAIDPSYHPEGEDLLYEGDMDLDPGQAQSEEPKEEGFIVDLHDTSMDLEFSGNKSTSRISSTPKTATSSSSGGNSATKEKLDAPPSNETPKKSPSVRTTSPECNLWISGLVASVRALDLQTLFSPFGKVVTAKVVAKAQSRNQRFGYVTMTTVEEANRCIKELSGTELKGRKIVVDMAKSAPPISQPSKSTATPSSTNSDKHASTNTTTKHSPKMNEKKAIDKGSEVKAVAPFRKSLESDSRRKSPIRIVRGRDRPRPRGRSPRRSPPLGRIAPRRSPPTGLRRSPPPGMRRSPPHGMRRSPPSMRKHHSPSPPIRGSIQNRLGARGPTGGREVTMRRDVDRVRDRHVSGNESILQERERERQEMELHLHQRRLVQERDRENEIAQRQLEAERNRHEQEMSRRVAEIRERDARDREARDRQLAEQERVFRERERELREREIRERQRRETLEKELRERELRERELRDREKRMKDAFERDIQARDLKSQREKEARERDTRLQSEREREFREREKKLKEDTERIEVARRHYEEEQRRFRAAREREESERRDREEAERREREKKLQEDKNKRKLEDDLRAKRERDKREEEKQRSHPTPSTSGRLGKRSFDDNSSSMAYDGASKRQATHSDGMGGYTGSAPPSVFGRLDPHPSQKREVTGGGVPGDFYHRGNETSSYERRGGYGDQYVNPSTNFQQMSSPRTGAVGSHLTSNMFGKPVTSMHATPLRQKPETGVLASVTPEVMSAAAQVLSSMNKQVGLQNLPHTHGASPQLNVAAHLQQLAAMSGTAGLSSSHLQGNYGDGMRSQVPFNSSQGMLHGDGVSFLSGGSVGMGMKTKLPPEGDRYNRRVGAGRSGGHHGAMRGGNMYHKGGRM